MIDPRDENTAKLLVPYSMGCGSDKQCTPDLKLNVSFMNIRYVLKFVVNSKKIYNLIIFIVMSSYLGRIKQST